MNNTIWKYELKITDQFDLQLPAGANILCIQLQFGQPCLWAEVDNTETHKEIHIIETFGTGHQLDESPRKYIGSYQTNEGLLVFHVYKRL